MLAVPGLESLLLPMTAYARLRFGGSTVRETLVDAPRAEFLTPVAPVWPLRTERLLLRPFEPRDGDAFIDAWADEGYASMLLSGTLNESEVREMVAAAPGRATATSSGWSSSTAARSSATRSSSSRALASARARSAGRPLRACGVAAMPPRPARAVLRLGFEHYGLRRIVANLDARNDRSAALCERLGMRRETHRLGDFWSEGRWTDSGRAPGALLREEWRGQS